MTRKLVLFSAVLLLGLAARESAAQSVKGTAVAERVSNVMKDIKWAPDLKTAQERAGKAKKLVFWLQIVGNLDGGL